MYNFTLTWVINKHFIFHSIHKCFTRLWSCYTLELPQPNKIGRFPELLQFIKKSKHIRLDLRTRIQILNQFSWTRKWGSHMSRMCFSVVFNSITEIFSGTTKASFPLSKTRVRPSSRHEGSDFLSPGVCPLWDNMWIGIKCNFEIWYIEYNEGKSKR
jgi:hypothetical protein